MENFNKCDIISQLFQRVYTDLQHGKFGGGRDEEWAFFVHSSVELENLQNVIQNRWKSLGQYDLQIGENIYKMQLIVLTLRDTETFKLFLKLIETSQFSFPWKDLPTLYINSSQFCILEKFIEMEQLQRRILQIEEKCGISSSGELIRVVTFKPSPEKFSLIDSFGNFLKSNNNLQRFKNYYIVVSFPWLQPWRLEHFKLPIDTECINKVFPIILNHLATLGNHEELDIFDLISLRLGICDFRNPLPTSHLNDAIDYFIGRTLRTVVQNKHFDIDQYIFDANARGFLAPYVVYEFQNYFETVKFYREPVLSYFRMTSHETLKLVESNDVPRQVKQKFNIKFTIDGANFDKMSLTLFLDLLACENVKKIYLDTNHRWTSNFDDKFTQHETFGYNLVSVHLFGHNTFYFIENFIASLKTVGPKRRRRMCLYIHSKPNNFLVFDNLWVDSLEFVTVKIDADMLTELANCDLKAALFFYKCTIENSVSIWRLLSNLKGLGRTIIREDENTWRCFFEYVINTMVSMNLEEFIYEVCVEIENYDNDMVSVSLPEIKFTIDALKSKLQLTSVGSGRPIDLYFLKNRVPPDNDVKSDYEFYQ